MHRVFLAVVAVLATNALAATRDAHAVQLSLLHLFGLKSRPRTRRDANIHVPPSMIHLYKRQKRLVSSGLHFVRKDSGTANTVRSFTHTDSPDGYIETDPNRSHFWFNVTSIPSSEEPRAAELRLYREAILDASTDPSGNHLQRVEVYDVVRPGIEAIIRLLDTRVVDIRRTRWERFDVLPAIQRWHAQPRKNHGLVVHVSNVAATGALANSDHVRLRRSASTSDHKWHATQPVLLVFTDDGRTSSSSGHLRTERSADQIQKRKERGRKAFRDNCRRHKLYVDFSDVGWNDWIVAPPGYEAFYCHGDCPFPLAEHLNATNHAIVQTLMNSVNSKAVPKACCVPTELTPISMLYLDEYDKVVLKNYQEMVVEGCGCR